MRLFSRSKKDALIAAFDINSSSVGGILFFCHPHRIPEILVTSRISTDFLPDLNFSKIQRSLHKTFERVIAGFKKQMPEGRKKPDLVLIMFSSPYYVSQTKIIKLPKLKPFKITDKFLENLIADEIMSFKKRWQGTEVIEAEKIRVDFDNSEISFYMSLGIKSIQDKLQECILHSFGETKMRFQSFPFVAFNALKTVMDISEDLLLVDVGGETTDLILIRNGILEETISFPLGENFLIRKIAAAFRLSLEESFFLLRQYIRGDLHADTHKKVREIVENATAKWCQFFEDSFKESPDFSSSRNLLFIGGKGALIFKDFSLCIKEKPIKSRFLLAEAFKNHFNFKRGFSENQDISLMLSVLFADKLFLSR